MKENQYPWISGERNRGMKTNNNGPAIILNPWFNDVLSKSLSFIKWEKYSIIDFGNICLSEVC